MEGQGMSVLSDRTIRALCEAPMVRMVQRLEGPLAIQPVSVDLHFSGVRRPSGKVWAPQSGDWVIYPGEFILGEVQEVFAMPDNVVGEVSGKSTMAREGLQVHAAGLVDPGFRGGLTLELKNLHHADPIVLIVGEPLAQVKFTWTDEPVEKPYGHPDLGSHYQGQVGPTPSWRRQ